MTAIARYVFVTLALAFAATPASADDEVAAFYRGKTLQITNAFAEGGLYSTLTRLFAHASAPPYSGSAERDPDLHAGRRRPAADEPSLQRRAQGRHRDRR